ncbi:MAG: DUF1177 domain-containing protein [Candidatus Aminicenantes bacterium]|nr:MAG: DUF1177 domain-containing protein [Candidatus Aminicenantes bacterium]
MALKQVLEILDLMECAVIEEKIVSNYFMEKGLDKRNLELQSVRGEKGETTFVKIQIFGTDGRLRGGQSPTLGIIGRLGGIGARPDKIGLVSDADGAIAALACASKILDLNRKGDSLKGDIIISTHLSPSSPIIPHDPVPFMDAPITIETMNKYEVDERMEAILSVDTTKGNRIINRRGFAISPTAKNGYILRVSEDLLDIMQAVTGKLPEVFAITQQDITPYGNDLYHLNSIMQPATATEAPVVGIAITSEVAVAGCATGANQYIDIEMAVRFVVEVAKAWGMKQCSLYNEKEFHRLLSLYGSLDCFKTLGKRE